MKISAHNHGPRYRRTATRHGERGFLVVALLAIVAIMLIYININVRLLGGLKRELKLIDQKQIQRLEKIGAQPSPSTNVVSTATAGITSARAGQ
jgi:hypothetical protein